MDRNIAMSNDKVSETNNVYNFNTSMSQQAYTREGQNTWNQGRNSTNDTSSGHLPPMDFGPEFGQGGGGGGGGQCGGDSGAGGGPLAGLPNPMSMLGGGGDSSSGGSSPLSALSGLFGGSGDGSSSSPLSSMGSLLGNQTSDSSSSSSSGSSSTMSEVGEIAGAVAMFC